MKLLWFTVFGFFPRKNFTIGRSFLESGGCRVAGFAGAVWYPDQVDRSIERLNRHPDRWTDRRNDKSTYRLLDHFSSDITACSASGPTALPVEGEGVPYGNLDNRVFNSRCTPLITPDTTIIAVCGPNEDNAGPNADGRFFSDFYLFHHLFRDTVKRQYWMTCVDPRHMVDRYVELVYGDPRSDDRRIMLDESMKDNVKDIRVLGERDLLERFLSCVADVSELFKTSRLPILVLVFGHRFEGFNSITIGGTTGSLEKCPKLTRLKLNETLLRYYFDPNVAMLVSFRYGSWTQICYLNITAMTSMNETDFVFIMA